MLDYIKEQLRRYDPDGLELDFQREITCFDIENRPDRSGDNDRFRPRRPGDDGRKRAAVGHKIRSASG